MWLFQWKKALRWFNKNEEDIWTPAEDEYFFTCVPPCLLEPKLSRLGTTQCARPWWLWAIGSDGMSRRGMEVVNEKYEIFEPTKGDASPIPRDWGIWSISYFLGLPPNSGEVGKDDRQGVFIFFYKGVFPDLFGEFWARNRFFFRNLTQVPKGNDLEVLLFVLFLKKRIYTKYIICYLLISCRQQKQ